MANIKSSKKRISVNDRQKQENKFFKATVNTYIKKFRKLVREANLEQAEVQLKETISLINSSQSKGIFHKNNASRKISRLSSALHAAKNANVKEEVKVVNEEVATPAVEVVAEPAKKAVKKTTTKKVAEVEEKEVVAPAKKATTTAKKTATTTAKKTATTTAKKAESTTKKTTAKKAE